MIITINNGLKSKKTKKQLNKSEPYSTVSLNVDVNVIELGFFGWDNWEMERGTTRRKTKQMRCRPMYTTI